MEISRLHIIFLIIFLSVILSKIYFNGILSDRCSWVTGWIMNHKIMWLGDFLQHAGVQVPKKSKITRSRNKLMFYAYSPPTY